MSETEQNRSEQPTPFKLMRAREKGTVARGMDLGFLAAVGAFFVFMATKGREVVETIALGTRQAIVTAPQAVGSPDALLTITGMVLSAIVRPVVLMAGAIFLAVLVAEIAQTGFVFSAEPLKPDFSRLNPAAGLKRVFSLKLLIETFKNVLKFAVYVALAALVIRSAQANGFASVVDAPHLASAMQRYGSRLILFFVAAAAAFAGLDQLIVRRQFLRQMRMSRREVRQELRDREGEPRLKQKRKQLHREFAKASRSLQGVRGADVLLVNPTHYAVGLRYDPRRMSAPAAVALGTDDLALRLKKLAFLYGVTIIENPPLARALHAACELDRQVPETFYRPVADVYLALREQRKPLRT